MAGPALDTVRKPEFQGRGGLSHGSPRAEFLYAKNPSENIGVSVLTVGTHSFSSAGTPVKAEVHTTV